MRLTLAMQDAIEDALGSARQLRATRDHEAAWAELMRAHLISQPNLPRHLTVHCAMLSQALHERDAKEATGQLLRLVLAPLGHILGRTPWGNPGRATVSKFAKAPLPADVARLYAEAGIKVT